MDSVCKSVAAKTSQRIITTDGITFYEGNPRYTYGMPWKDSDSYSWETTCMETFTEDKCNRRLFGSFPGCDGVDRIYKLFCNWYGKPEIEIEREKIKDISKYEGIMYDENNLFDLMDLIMNTNRIIDKLESYVSLLGDEDTRINKNQELKEEVNNLYSEYINATYFVDNSILKMDYSKIEEFIDKNNKLKEYQLYFKEMFRYKKHTLSDKEEKLLANLSKALGNNYDTYELLKDSDLVFPNFLVDGCEYELDGSKYSLYIEDNNRDIRKAAFNDLYGVYKQYKNVFANLISSNVKEEESLAKIRKYDGAIEASMYRDELDISVHDNLVSVIHNRMNVLHDYYELKKVSKEIELDALTKKARVLLTAGILCICISFVLWNINNLTFINEIISVLSSFSIWEFGSLMMYDYDTVKEEVIKYNHLSKIRVIYDKE